MPAGSVTVTAPGKAVPPAFVKLTQVACPAAPGAAPSPLSALAELRGAFSQSDLPFAADLLEPAGRQFDV